MLLAPVCAVSWLQSVIAAVAGIEQKYLRQHCTAFSKALTQVFPARHQGSQELGGVFAGAQQQHVRDDREHEACVEVCRI